MAPAIASSAASFDAAAGSRSGGLPEEEERSNHYPHLILRNRLTALVVDGERFCRMVERALLEHYGVETQAVDNGQAAVDLLASGANFDLIVIDMILPILNGLEATRQIRSMGIRTKMLGVTACWYERERQAFLAAGVDEFIEKPLSPERLVPILRELDGQ